jgi:hypothetical protein
MKTTTEAELREWIAAGVTVSEIADRLAVPTNYVYTMLRLLGLSAERKRKVAAYFEGIKGGMSLSEIGAANGVTGPAVNHALRRAGLPTCASAYLRQQAGA